MTRLSVSKVNLWTSLWTVTQPQMRMRKLLDNKANVINVVGQRVCPCINPCIAVEISKFPRHEHFLNISNILQQTLVCHISHFHIITPFSRKLWSTLSWWRLNRMTLFNPLWRDLSILIDGTCRYNSIHYLNQQALGKMHFCFTLDQCVGQRQD